MARLPSAAHGTPERGVRLFRHKTRTGHWILASASADGQLCFTLALVGTTLESTCASHAQLIRRPLLAYAADEPASSGGGWDDYVVYGLVSSRVRAAMVRLSDCSSLPVRLSTRPLFWAFVPERELTRRAVPVGYVARIDSRIVRGQLGRPSHPAGRCPG